jgi:hypothetical protein
MMKQIFSVGLVLPFVACAVSPSEEDVATMSSRVIVDAGGTGTSRCICVGDPTPPGVGPHSGHKCGDICPNPVQSLVIAPGQTNLDIIVEAGVDWPDPGSVTFSISGLPAGVTAKYVQTSGYIPPVQGITGVYEFSASPGAPLEQGDIVWITAQSGADTGTVAIKLSVAGTCVPSGCEGQCGAVANGCSGTINCGGCGTNQFCNASHVCQDMTTHTCPSGTHSCGDGTCARICQ